MTDLDYADILPTISDSAESHDPGFGRRRFLQGLLASTAAGAILPSFLADAAYAATSPLGANDGVLVVVVLGGGNDGLNLHAPIDAPTRGRYQDLRQELALAPGALRPTAEGYGLHPALGYLHQRYRKGQVAVVRGTGQGNAPLSHAEAMTSMMAGTSDGSVGTGWLGRYLDGVGDSSGGLRGLSVSPSVPLYLRGSQARITTVPRGPQPEPGDTESVAIRNVLRSFNAVPTGLGPLGDEIAQVGRESLDRVRTLRPIYGAALPTVGVSRDLALAARLVNLNLGARVIGVSFDGFDTHIGQAGTLGTLLTQLDAAIEGFFDSLAPAYRSRTTLMAISEFGRRPGRNGSGGTDHGTSNVILLAGDNVRGGLHGSEPSLDKLDQRGNTFPTTDLRSVYASVLHRWLAADPKQVLGKAFPELDLFAATPGRTR